MVHLLTWNDALARYSRHVWRSRTTLFRGTRKDTRQSWTTHASFLRDHERKFSIHDSGNYGGNHGRCVPCSRIVSPRALSLDHARFSGLTAPSSNRSSSCVERSSSPLSPRPWFCPRTSSVCWKLHSTDPCPLARCDLAAVSVWALDYSILLRNSTLLRNCRLISVDWRITTL